MKRVGLVVAYDGTNYSGWQIQPNGITIQGVLNDALTDLLGEKIEIMGASRTDAGVHALGNVAVFDTNTRIPGEKISYALNQRLPEDIRIQLSEEVEPDFHPRYCDSEKTYEYRILNRKFPVPTERLYSYFYHYKLDVDKMREATSYLIGRHDFASFCGTGAQVKSTVRTLTGIDIWRDGDIVTIQVRGEGFLYNMVRIIAGTLIQLAREFAVRDVELEERVARRQRHFIQLADVPCRDDDPAGVRVVFQLVHHRADLVDMAAVRRRPGTPLFAVNRPQIAIFICPLVPDSDIVFMQIRDVGVTLQEPQQFMDDGA